MSAASAWPEDNIAVENLELKTVEESEEIPKTEKDISILFSVFKKS